MQWNLTLKIDIAEQDKDKQIHNIKSQGLAEAEEVHEWNKKQPPGFWKPPQQNISSSSPDEVTLGIFDWNFYSKLMSAVFVVCAGIWFLLHLRGSFAREKFCMSRHILMESEDELLKIKKRLDAGEDFSELAKEYSTCPSKTNGGHMGKRTDVQMSQEMSSLCFNPNTKVGCVSGPIKTKFGFHLVVVDERHGVEELVESEQEATKKEK